MQLSIESKGYMISDTVVHSMIRAWKRARLSTGIEALGYPTENILSKAGKGRSNRPPPTPDGQMTDAEIVQTIVSRMPQEMRHVFEAFHLMLIRSERCRELPHKARALALGISYNTYKARRDSGFAFIREWLPQHID